MFNRDLQFRHLAPERCEPPMIQMGKRDLSIGVSAGRNKHTVTLASLGAGYLNVLVTDEQTALFFYDQAKH